MPRMGERTAARIRHLRTRKKQDTLSIPIAPNATATVPVLDVVEAMWSAYGVAERANIAALIYPEGTKEAAGADA